MVPRSSVRSLVLALLVLPQKILELVGHPLLADVGVEAFEHLAEPFQGFAAQAAAGLSCSHFVLHSLCRPYRQLFYRARLRPMSRPFARPFALQWRRARHLLLFRTRPKRFLFFHIHSPRPSTPDPRCPSVLIRA